MSTGLRNNLLLPRRHFSAALWMIAGVHALPLAMLLWSWALWPWALTCVLATQALIVTATLLPRSQLLGSNLTRLPAPSVVRGEIALSFDDGPDPAVTPALLDLLDAHGVRASFFCIGRRAAAHPQLCREIVRRGHAVENHGARHRHDFALRGPRGYARELQAGQALLRAACGVEPRLFRAPAGFRNPFLWPQLARLDLRLVSWTRRGFDTRCGDPARVLARLRRGLRAGDILLLHDGHAARTAQGRPVLLEVLPALLTAIAQAGLRPVTLRHALGLADAAADAVAAMPAGAPGAASVAAERGA